MSDKIKRGERCRHNVRWPHECKDCLAESELAPARGSVACDQQLIDDVMDAADKLTKASDAATLAGLRVTMQIGEHIRIPGPSCPSVCVEIERVSVRSRYTPNTGRKY